MAEENGKRIKTEQPDGTEAINSLNEEDAEKKLVDEANKKEDDYDSEPTPLQADTGSAELFPGVPCTTVAKRCKKGDDDPAPLFLNRYGPRAVGWFVWRTTPANLDGRSIDDLQNVSEKFHRVLDQPVKQGTPRYRASDVFGIMNIVWDCEGFQERPMEAAELLNPDRVKRADELTTAKARRDWLKEKENRLDKYPTTHVDVKFHKRINDVTGRLKDAGVDVFSNWETGSQYKSLYRKAQIEVERRVYQAAKRQAERFTQWYETRLPEQYAEYRRSLSREPTVQPFKRSKESASPAYDDESPEPKVKKEPGLTETDAQQDQSQKQSDPSATDDDELSEGELEEAALEGWCAAKGITLNTISSKDRRRFNMYYDVYKKNM